jgi:hypothetical protein
MRDFDDLAFDIRVALTHKTIGHEAKRGERLAIYRPNSTRRHPPTSIEITPERCGRRSCTSFRRSIRRRARDRRMLM